MGRTACTESQCLYKGALYLYITKELVQNNAPDWQLTAEHFKTPSPYKHMAVLICDTFVSLLLTYNYWSNFLTAL